MKTIFRVSRAFKRDPGFQEKPGLSREIRAFKRDPGFQERSGLSRESREFQERSGLSREIRAFKRDPGRFKERVFESTGFLAEGALVPVP